MAINSDSSFTFGFYNSLNHDRAYNAEQLSTLFNGIINDGVFETIGNCLTVKEGTRMTVNVDTGRAWFDGTWSNNDALYPVTVEDAELILDRIDAVVLQVDHNDSGRENKLMVVKGTPSSEPVKPTMIKEELLKQYPLAYIYVEAGVTEIKQSKIENAVGMDECPFITGVMETVDLNVVLGQWQAELDEFCERNETDFNGWMTHVQNEFNSWMDGEESDFMAWFQRMKDQLSEDAAGHLQQQIDELWARKAGLEEFTKEEWDAKTEDEKKAIDDAIVPDWPMAYTVSDAMEDIVILQSEICPMFSEEQTYEVGDYAQYKGIAYRCISAVETPGVFNPTNWRLTTVSTEVKKLNSDLGNINVYVGEDKKLHFVDKDGADSVLPFSSGKSAEEIYNGSITTATTLTVEGDYDYIIVRGGVSGTIYITIPLGFTGYITDNGGYTTRAVTYSQGLITIAQGTGPYQNQNVNQIWGCKALGEVPPKPFNITPNVSGTLGSFTITFDNVNDVNWFIVDCTQTSSPPNTVCQGYNFMNNTFIGIQNSGEVYPYDAPGTRFVNGTCEKVGNQIIVNLPNWVSTVHTAKRVIWG